jgi:exopolyphosphatase / guanosine-5'-triphosphate,3'-diphosphate pyrophosphatase
MRKTMPFSYFCGVQTLGPAWAPPTFNYYLLLAMRVAVIDLGTNTFHLLIAEVEKGLIKTLHREHRPTKIGKGGINQGVIQPEAIARAVDVLEDYCALVDAFGVPLDHVRTIGTSAIRMAANSSDFQRVVLEKTGFSIRVISGEREAALIYEGVRQALALGDKPSLIMDIGGGSVEFIIANDTKIFWKQSFEIGGQRLLERFMKTDPISASAVGRLHTFFQEQLLPLHNAMHQYEARTLVGSSGTFDTLTDIDFMHRLGCLPPPNQTNFNLPLSAFKRAYDLIITRNQAERMAISGMIELRVEMIVVAMVLIDYVLKAFDIQQINCSTYALKEGILQAILTDTL